MTATASGSCDVSVCKPASRSPSRASDSVRRRPRTPRSVEPGPLLGSDTGGHYPVTTAPLLPGTTLALYTDGLVELPGTDATRTTSDLAGQLDAADGHDLERIIDRLVHHTTPTGQHTDDIAVLLLRAYRPDGHRA
ncbi:SpoIIE family protein phosphatase [Streptomyces violaceus]|uniref:Serine/threonine-protein phosphatase n=1 Tax=Streptomyces violaceus TaxID=1936 RepID=A0ABZ1NJ82_STRVL|nr:SpoIIE family protein phosphatase [Streptomyces violaceus]